MSNSHPIDLIILCGGKGSRLKKLNNKHPKALTKYKNIHFLQLIINYYSRYNIRKIFLLCGYKSRYIFKHYNKKVHNFISIECIKDKKLMGTGGALFKIKKKIKNDFVIVNGDTICEPDLGRLISLTKQKNKKLGIFLKKGNYSSYKLNNLDLSKANEVKLSCFITKKINCGVYFFKKNFLKKLNNLPTSLENDYVLNLIKSNHVCGLDYRGLLYDIGTIKDYVKSKKILIKYFFRPAVFLDRDNTIIFDKGYTYKIKDLKFKPNFIKVIKKFIKLNYYIFLVTNQGGIAKKKFGLEDFKKFQLFLKKKLLNKNIFLDDVQYCPHHPDGSLLKFKKKCFCRKTNNLMFVWIKKKFIFNIKNSIMVGNSFIDKKFAVNSNLKFFSEKIFFKN